MSYIRLILTLILLFLSSQVLAHEGWILTPSEMLLLNGKAKPELFTQWSTINTVVLSCALLLALFWVKLRYTGAREMFPDLQERLSSYSEYSAVILRLCLTWALLASAFALEPRVGNTIFQSPTLLAPDLELRMLDSQWMWIREAQILLAIMFLFGIYVRAAAVLLIAVCVLGCVIFGHDMATYFTAVVGIAIYLLLQGAGSRHIPLPVFPQLQPLVTRFESVPRQRAQFLLRILAGLNFLYLGVYFKVLQPNLALGIVEIYKVPILSLAPEFFVLIMAVIETLIGMFLIMGVLVRPVSIFLLCAFIFFATFLDESYTAHIIFYGIVLTFLFNSAGHWRRPEATDKAAQIVILGGGLAAIRAAMKLEKLRGQYTNVAVTLVTPTSEFLFTPLLPEVVGGSIQPANIVNPIRRLLPSSRVLEADVQALNTKKRNVVVSRAGGATMSIDYDELIMAQEAVQDHEGIVGLAQHGLAFNSICDALFIRQSIMKILVEAEHQTDSATRRAMLTFSIIGGCERGCGAAMEISRLLKSALCSFPMLRQEQFSVVLFESADTPSNLPQALYKARNRLLKRHRIELRNIEEIASVSAMAIRLQHETLPCATAVNARMQVPKDYTKCAQHSWVASDYQLRVSGEEHIWVAGDNSALLKDCLRGHGERINLGEKAAYNAWAQTQQYPLVDYLRPSSWMLNFHMGLYSVTKLGPFVIFGKAAGILSRLININTLPGLERNLRIAIDRILNVPFRNDIAVLTTDRNERPVQAYYHAGDEVMRQGDYGRTAYLIQSGTVSLYRGDIKVAERGRGEIIGELAFINNDPRRVSARCNTDVAVTCLNQQQFESLMSGLREFGEAIKHKRYGQNAVERGAWHEQPASYAVQTGHD